VRRSRVNDEFSPAAVRRGIPRAAKFYDPLADTARLDVRRKRGRLAVLLKPIRRKLMTDLTEIAKAYELHQQAVAQVNAINKSAVFDALTTAGIAIVNVTFDGEGDSGQIDNITADDAAAIPQIHIELQRTVWGSGKLDSIQNTLHDAIETLCYDYLSQEQGGWENNDGAFGEFIFHVAERRIELEFNSRFSDSTLFNYSF
jgi:hypothetical protein